MKAFLNRLLARFSTPAPVEVLIVPVDNVRRVMDDFPFRPVSLVQIHRAAKSMGLPKPSAKDLRERGAKSVLVRMEKTDGHVMVRMWTW